ncbi:hypothetical protein LZ30DRAFT_194595 [Colletotrichum cereale]|nr:hypothetical protein LZ30DRAFT_194595 [Colletotrichum cereale]
MLPRRGAASGGQLARKDCGSRRSWSVRQRGVAGRMARGGPRNGLRVDGFVRILPTGLEGVRREAKPDRCLRIPKSMLSWWQGRMRCIYNQDFRMCRRGHGCVSGVWVVVVGGGSNLTEGGRLLAWWYRPIIGRWSMPLPNLVGQTTRDCGGGCDDLLVLSDERGGGCGGDGGGGNGCSGVVV